MVLEITALERPVEQEGAEAMRRLRECRADTAALRERLDQARSASVTRRADLARSRLEAGEQLAELQGLRQSLQEACTPRSPKARRSQGRRSPGDSSQATDKETARMHTSFAATRDETLRSQLLARYDGLALALARKFPGRGESRDDLAQVARIGLIHAVDRFDPERGRPFVVFARATISGELKRHLRDHTWTMRIPRSLHDNHLNVLATVDDLTQELGRSPRIAEVAARCGLSEEKVLEAVEVDRPLSLNAADGGGHLEPSTEEAGLELVEEHSFLATLVGPLPQREQRVLGLRFVDGLSQSQIAERLGVSQMCISRVLARALERMRKNAASAARADEARVPAPACR
jgi:RNA polymerase sigma-B factor